MILCSRLSITLRSNASLAAANLACYRAMLPLSHPRYHNATENSFPFFFLFTLQIYRLYKLFRHCDISGFSALDYSRPDASRLHFLTRNLQAKYVPFIQSRVAKVKRETFLPRDAILRTKRVSLDLKNFLQFWRRQ